VRDNADTVRDQHRREAGAVPPLSRDFNRALAGIVLLLALLAAICAPLSPLFDPDEGYYPATAAETLRSGTYWDLRLNGEPRWEKPFLSYGFIEASFQLFGESVAAARLPSAVQGVALVAIVGLIVARLAGARAGVLCSLVVGTSLGVSVFSRIAHPEIAVVLGIIAAELLICVWLSASNRIAERCAAVGVGLAVGFGVLAKGPVAAALPLLMLVCMIALVRPKDRLGALVEDAGLSVCVAAVLALPWYVAMTARHGTAFLEEAVWRQNVGRYTSTVYGHRTSVFALCLPAVLALLPWTGMLPQALRRLRARDISPRELLRTGMFASAVTAFVFYSLSRSKLPSYVLVCVPPIGIMIGLLLDEEFDRPTALRLAWLQTSALLGGAAAVLVSSPLWIGHVVTPKLLGAVRPQPSVLEALMTAVTVPLGCLIAVGAGVLAITKTARSRMLAVVGVGALAPVVILVTARPLLQETYPLEALGRLIESDQGPVWLVGRRAPSLTFYARQPVDTAPDLPALENEIRRQHQGWLVLTREDWAQLAASDTVRGTNSSVVAERGRMVLVRFTVRSPGLHFDRESVSPRGSCCRGRARSRPDAGQGTSRARVRYRYRTRWPAGAL